MEAYKKVLTFSGFFYVTCITNRQSTYIDI